MLEIVQRLVGLFCPERPVEDEFLLKFRPCRFVSGKPCENIGIRLKIIRKFKMSVQPLAEVIDAISSGKGISIFQKGMFACVLPERRFQVVPWLAHSFLNEEKIEVFFLGCV